MGEKNEKIRNIPKIEYRKRDFPGSTPVIGPIEEDRDQIPSLLAELRSITRKPFSPDRNRERDRERKRIFSTKGNETAVFRLRFEVNISSSTVFLSLLVCVYIHLERERALRSLDSWLLSRRWWKSSRLRWWPNTRVGCFRNTRGSSPSSADLYVRSGQSMTTNTRAVARVSYVRWKRVRIVWAQVPSLGLGVEMTWASGVCGSELEWTRTPLDLFFIR